MKSTNATCWKSDFGKAGQERKGKVERSTREWFSDRLSNGKMAMLDAHGVVFLIHQVNTSMHLLIFIFHLIVQDIGDPATRSWGPT